MTKRPHRFLVSTLACAGLTVAATGSMLAGTGAATAATAQQTMQAIVMRAGGGPEVLSLENVPIPEPAAGQVRIRIVAAAVNPVDWKRRKGYKPPAGVQTTPPVVILGFDAAGTVDKLGSGVTGFRVGDAVYAALQRNPQGAYAQYAVVSADDVAPKPARLDYDQAAGLVTGGLTALRVVRAAGIQKGQTVLVQGGAGGVGTPLVQILHERGATVLATASARNSHYLKSLGVDRVIDYTAAPFEESVSNVDVVLDLVGGDVTARSVKVVKPGGLLITIANRPPQEACSAAQIRCPAFAHPDAPIGPDLRELSAFADSGKLQLHVDKVFPLAEAAAAQQLSETGRTRGKIVLRVP